MHHVFNRGQAVFQPSNDTPELRHNLIVIEIYNNWSQVLELIEKVEEAAGKEVKVDLIEREWWNFISQNGINLKTYEKKEDFIEKNIKLLVKPEEITSGEKK